MRQTKAILLTGALSQVKRIQVIQAKILGGMAASIFLPRCLTLRKKRERDSRPV